MKKFMYANLQTFIADNGGADSGAVDLPGVLGELSKLTISAGDTISRLNKDISINTVLVKNTGARIQVRVEKNQAVLTVPVGLIFRFTLLFSVFTKQIHAYQIVIAPDGEWHNDVPFQDFSTESRQFHPLTYDAYSPNNILTLSEKAKEIQSQFSEEQINDVKALYSYAISFALLHERAHVQSHFDLYSRINNDSTNSDAERALLIKIIETDADARAMADFVRLEFSAYFSEWSNADHTFASFIQHEIFQKSHLLGMALVLWLALARPDIRPINGHDITSYSHPQVRMTAISDTLGKTVLDAANRFDIPDPNCLAELSVVRFVRGALSAISGATHEKLAYGPRRKEHIKQSLDFRYFLSMSVGVYAQRRVHARAKHVNEMREKSLKRIHGDSFLDYGLMKNCIQTFAE